MKKAITMYYFVILPLIILGGARWLSFMEPQNSEIEFGRRLFFDTRLSVNGTKSCATCHDPRLAFTDGYRRSTGAFADEHRHNSPSLINLSTYRSLNWNAPYTTNLTKHMDAPLFGTSPIEMGAATESRQIISLLEKDEIYKRMYQQLYGSFDEQVWDKIKEAIAAFVQTLEFRNSAYDRFVKGDGSAMSKEAAQGMKLFFSDRAKCGECHGGIDFNEAQSLQNVFSDFFNVGLYAPYPATDKGLAEVTLSNDDEGKFRTPSLRNVAVTAPYMHDGSVRTLEECLQIFNQGGRISEWGGDGRMHPAKSNYIQALGLSEEEQRSLLIFLEALTDTSYLSKPQFTNPYTTQ